MEFTNLLLATIIIGLVLTGTGVFIGELQTNYSNVQNANLPNFTTVNTQLNNNLTKSLNQSLTYRPGDQTFALAFGYLFGGFNALQTLASTPGILIGIMGQFSSYLGIYYPAWLDVYVQLTLSAFIIIGILYYLFKVR